MQWVKSRWKAAYSEAACCAEKYQCEETCSISSTLTQITKHTLDRLLQDGKLESVWLCWSLSGWIWSPINCCLLLSLLFSKKAQCSEKLLFLRWAICTDLNVKVNVTKRVAFLIQINLSVTQGGKRVEVSGHIRGNSISVTHKLLSVSRFHYETIFSCSTPIFHMPIQASYTLNSATDRKCEKWTN